jgi:sphingomyelin phosphodiesterase acid-like 3
MHCRNLRLIGLLFALILQLQLTACGGGSTATSNSFQAVVLSDVHINPFYDPDQLLFNKLVATDADGWADVFKTSTVTGLPVWGNDTNYPLFAIALSSIKQNLGASPVIIFTGDILGHGFAQKFYAHYYNGQAVPANPDPAAVAAMQSFADKTVDFFTKQVRATVGNIPVMFAVGNNDSYADQGPDSIFLANTAEYFYSNFVKGTVDHQQFLNTFTTGGYYSAELPGTNLQVIGLNTVPFSPTYPVVDTTSAVAAELDWLDSRLAAATVAGKKVWLLMHIPPGANILGTAPTVDGNGHIAAAAMLWKPEYQARFLQILANYPGLISLTLAGHTHMDEYRIMSTSGVLEITPSISPRSGNNPAYKVFKFSTDTFKPTDYRSLNYDLAANPGQFNDYYTFSAAYSSQGLLDDSLAQLYPILVTSSAKQVLYRGEYYSGHNSPGYITDANWPVFYCGIGNTGQQDFSDCVNNYAH